MSSVLALAVVTALVLFAAVAAVAEPSDACGSSDPVSVAQGASSLTVCVKTGALNGSLTAAGDPASQTGYILADGDSSNPDPFGGYIGVEGGNPNDNGGGPAIVGCADGDYNPAGANNVIFGSPNPPGDTDHQSLHAFTVESEKQSPQRHGRWSPAPRGLHLLFCCVRWFW
jgi:hypothetical protein